MKSAATVYIVTRMLYIEEGEGFTIEGVFASEEAARAFIDREPIPGNRYRIEEQEVRDA